MHTRLIRNTAAALLLAVASLGLAIPVNAAAPKCNANACSSYPPILPGCVYKNRVYICPR